jgi:hypothetical protein
MSDRPSNGDELLSYIAGTVEAMRDEMATKSDLAQMATKSDLAQMATKYDLAQLENRLVNKIEAEITAVRGDIERVDLRLDNIERTLSTRLDQLEAELSRLRSAVYLLAKDRPEILRLLGQ